MKYIVFIPYCPLSKIPTWVLSGSLPFMLVDAPGIRTTRFTFDLCQARKWGPKAQPAVGYGL